MSTPTQARVNQPVSKTSIPVLEIEAGQYIIDSFDYVWRVIENVVDGPMERGKVVIKVHMISFDRNKEPVESQHGYKIDCEPDDKMRVYTVDEIKRMVQ